MIIDGQTAHSVVHRATDTGGTHCVERVHGGNQTETIGRRDPPETRYVQLAFTHDRDEHVERLFRDAVDLLDVQQRAIAHRSDQRTVDEHIGVVTVGEHTCRVEVTDETRRCEFGVTFHELEAEPEFVGHGPQQRALTGARRPFEQHVTVGRQRGDHQFDLTGAPDHTTQHSAHQAAEHHCISH